jgi:two-component system, sensor histidine kinase RpfC
VVDVKSLEDLDRLSSESDFLSEIVNDFILDSEQVLGEIHQAAAAGDARAFRNSVHALRSSAANVGAVRLHRLCTALDARGPREASGEAPQLARLDEEFARYRTVIERYLAERRERGRPS